METPTPDVDPAAALGDNPPVDESNTAADNADRAKTFTQADIDRVVEQRLARERQKFADYDELKSAADELAKIREGEKTEMQRFQEELAAEREARAAAESTAATMKRTQYGMDKGLPRDLAELLTAADDDGLDAQIEKLLPHIAKPDTKPVITTSGGLRSGATGSGSSTADPKERAASAIRQLFDR